MPDTESTGWVVKDYRKNPIADPKVLKSPQPRHYFRALSERFRILRTNPKVVDKTPIVSVLLLEAANVQQIYRMWTEHTAAGQSLTAWVSVNVALWLWLNFYYVFNKDNQFAIRGTQLGIVLNFVVIMSVFYFRYIK